MTHILVGALLTFGKNIFHSLPSKIGALALFKPSIRRRINFRFRPILFQMPMRAANFSETTFIGDFSLDRAVSISFVQSNERRVTKRVTREEILLFKLTCCRVGRVYLILQLPNSVLELFLFSV